MKVFSRVLGVLAVTVVGTSAFAGTESYKYKKSCPFATNQFGALTVSVFENGKERSLILSYADANQNPVQTLWDDLDVQEWGKYLSSQDAGYQRDDGTVRTVNKYVINTGLPHGVKEVKYYEDHKDPSYARLKIVTYSHSHSSEKGHHHHHSHADVEEEVVATNCAP